MMWFRSRARDYDDWLEAIRPELRELPVPPLSDGLFDRIVASRAAGARTILPDGRVATDRAPARVALAVIAAALLVLIVPLRRPGPPRSEGDNAVASSERAAAEWLPRSIAFAQTEPRITRPNVPPVRWDRLDRLQPVRLEYLRLWRGSSRRETGRITAVVTLATDSVDGVPAWRLVSRNSGVRDGRAVLTIDSVFVTRNALQLLRRTGYERPYHRYDEISIVQAFHGDSVVGRMNATGADASTVGRPIARRLPGAGWYVVDAFAPVLLSAVTLGPDWTGYTVLVGWAVVDRDAFIRVDLRVEGEEVVTVPAGRFDCWRISIRYGRQSITYWARKADGVGVRTLDEYPASGSSREVILIKETRG